MSTSRNLNELTKEELKKFLDSFDEILCDQDGVLFSMYGIPIEGGKESIHKLRKYGKGFRIVSNNCIQNFETWKQKLEKYLAFSPNEDELLNPTSAIIHYFKSIEFDKEIFIIGSTSMKEDFEKAGLKVADRGPNVIEESTTALFKNIDGVSKNIGAVVLDADLNMNYVRLLSALYLLKNPKILAVSGATENVVSIDSRISYIGPGVFQDILEEFSNRKFYKLGKPSIHFGEYIKTKVKHPSRTLFIGDTLTSDMSFATKCGFKKLLVLTGSTKCETTLLNAKEDQIPNFYIKSFGDLHKLIEEKLEKNNLL